MRKRPPGHQLPSWIMRKTFKEHQIRATKRENRIPCDTMKLQACITTTIFILLVRGINPYSITVALTSDFYCYCCWMQSNLISKLYITGSKLQNLSLLQDGRCQQKILTQNMFPPQEKLNSLGKSWGKKSWYLWTLHSSCFMFHILLNPPNTSTWQGPYNPIHQELKCHI